MDELVKIWGTPTANEVYMIAGWHQWADAGAISSGLPQYLAAHTKATRIGEIQRGGFYLFQMPGTHHLLRPEVKLQDGYRVELRQKKNEFYYTGDADKGLVVFLGEEPHMNVERYADAFLDGVQALRVRRVVALGGVYGSMPYDKYREVSCVYSLPRLKDELVHYAVRFSNYEGGVTIGGVIADRAEARDIEVVDFYAFVPAYDFSPVASQFQGIRIEEDYKAWHELMRRFNHMFAMGMDLSDLARRSTQLVETIESQLEDLARKMPQLNVHETMRKLSSQFEETPFMPLDDVWERELGDIFRGLDE